MLFINSILYNIFNSHSLSNNSHYVEHVFIFTGILSFNNPNMEKKTFLIVFVLKIKS